MSFDEERQEPCAAVAMTEQSDGRRGDRAGLTEHRRGDRAARIEQQRDDRRQRAANDWREVDRQLRRIACRRAAIDAEEAPWLLAAYRGAVHAELGHASFVDYVERVLGYGPRVAIDRLRVAEALEVLPATRAALAAGEVTYSAVRELTRVATPPTERAWLAATLGKTVREVEEMVSGHRPGDLPDDPTDPDLRPRVLRFEITPETFALFREAERRLAMELGHMLSDDELIAALCQAALVPPTWAPKNGTNASADAKLAVEGAVTAAIEGAATAAIERAATAAIEGAATTAIEEAATAAIEGVATATATSEDAVSEWESSTSKRADVSVIEARVRTVPRYQVAVTVCAACKRGWQDGAGQPIEIGPAAIATARCDAQEIGDVNAATSSGKRATRTIPPATRQKVLRRDHGRCIVPGCRSTRWIDLHHLLPRARGGSHDAGNLSALCSAHHASAHAGRLVITGEVGALKFHHADGRPWGAAPRDPRDGSETMHGVEAARAGGAGRSAGGAGRPGGEASSSETRREDLVRGALRKLGWSAGEAASAMERARAHVDDEAPIEAWIVAALRACRRAGT